MLCSHQEKQVRVPPAAASPDAVSCLGLGCLWFAFGLVSLAEDGFRGYRKPFVLFGRRRSSSPVSSSEKLKVIGETRSYNPTLLQPELRGRTGEGPQQRGWGG